MIFWKRETPYFKYLRWLSSPPTMPRSIFKPLCVVEVGICQTKFVGIYQNGRPWVSALAFPITYIPKTTFMRVLLDCSLAPVICTLPTLPHEKETPLDRFFSPATLTFIYKTFWTLPVRSSPFASGPVSLKPPPICLDDMSTSNSSLHGSNFYLNSLQSVQWVWVCSFLLWVVMPYQFDHIWKCMLIHYSCILTCCHRCS